MRLVIDTNIAISALITTGKTQELLFSPFIEAYCPDYLLEEIEKHRGTLLEKTGFTESELDKAIGFLMQKIEVIPSAAYERHRQLALENTPDKFDWPFIALAFELGCLLWTNDKKLREQALVETVSTRELAEKTRA